MAKIKSSSIVISIIVIGLIAVGLWAVFYVPGVMEQLNEIYLQIQKNLLATYSIPNWQLYLLLLCVVYAAVSVLLLLARPRQPKVTSYRQDTFLDIIWRWSYQRKMVVDLWCFCPDCNTELVYTYTGSRSDQETELFCERCDITKLRHDGDKTYLLNRVIRLIERKIRTEEWKTSLKKR
jgi:hypothetical protein